jgi:HK97 family phage prohead protease
MQRMTCGLSEIKLAQGANAMTFEGMGAVFGNVDSYGDVIAPGAFASWLSDVKSGKQPWPSMLAQHGGMGLSADDMTPVGIWTDLSEDGTGLSAKGKLAPTPRGTELHQLMKMDPRPAIDGLSIGYIAKEWEPRSKPEDPRRTLKRIDVMEISLVTFPANRLAKVTSVKSIEELFTLSEIEDYLRDAGGFSRNEAKTLIARVKKSTGADAGDGLAQIAASLTRNTNILKG